MSFANFVNGFGLSFFFPPTFIFNPWHFCLYKSSINEKSSSPTEISSFVKFYLVHQNVYPSRRNDGMTKQQTLVRRLNLYFVYKFAAHLLDQNMFYSQWLLIMVLRASLSNFHHKFLVIGRTNFGEIGLKELAFLHNKMTKPFFNIISERKVQLISI